MRFDFRFKRLKYDEFSGAIVRWKIREFNKMRHDDVNITYEDGPKYIDDVCHNLLEFEDSDQIRSFCEFVLHRYSNKAIDRYIAKSNSEIDDIWNNDKSKDDLDRDCYEVDYLPATDDKNIKFNIRLAKKHFEYYKQHNGDFEKFVKHFGYEFTEGTLRDHFKKYIPKEFDKWKYKTGRYDKSKHFIDRDNLK